MQSTEEIWKLIGGPYLDFYEASSLGRIRAAKDIIAENSSRWCKAGQLRYKKHEILKVPKGTYPAIYLYIPKSMRIASYGYEDYVHRLVYCAFHDIDILSIPQESRLCIDHQDNDGSNNAIDNLQLVTINQNVQKSYDNDESGRWSNRKSGVICIETNVSYLHLKDAVAATGFGDSRIIAACQQGTTCGGYHWRYIDEERHQSCVKSRPKRYRPDRIRKNTNKGNYVRCIETGQIEKASVMARQFGCTSSEVIYNAIDKNHGYSKFLDKHFELLEDYAIN